MHERTTDFHFIFEKLKEAVHKIAGSKLEPKILISDACNAIRNAFMLAFPNAKLMVMCYVHVLRNVDKQKDKYKKENRNEIFKDIETMHFAPSPAVFAELGKLFIKKWSKKEKAFSEYFQKQLVYGSCHIFT